MINVNIKEAENDFDVNYKKVKIKNDQNYFLASNAVT